MNRRELLRGIGLGAVVAAVPLPIQAAAAIAQPAVEWEAVNGVLQDVIYSITPMDTPLLSLTWGRREPEVHEWREDSLMARTDTP